MEKRRLVAPVLLTLILMALTLYMLFVPSHGDKGGAKRAVPTNMTYATAGTKHCKLRVLYYDSLSLHSPNETLAKALRVVAEKHGACIDVYYAHNATLRPILEISRYDIVVIRAHGGIWGTHGYYFATGLYSGDKLDIPPSLAARLAALQVLAVASPAVLTHGGVSVEEKLVIIGGRRFFDVVRPKNGSILVFMTCDSIRDPTFVSEALRAGASAYLGWTGLVTPSQIDAVLPVLLDELLTVYEGGGRGCAVTKVLERLAPLLYRTGSTSILTVRCKNTL